MVSAARGSSGGTLRLVARRGHTSFGGEAWSRPLSFGGEAWSRPLEGQLLLSLQCTPKVGTKI